MGWMEDEAMEKTWDDFWKTGKVTDYLAYRNVSDDGYRAQKEPTEHGTSNQCDGDGFDSHAY